ncbi:MAG: hypothetical protein IJX55_07145 [Clostridia bacterium]|nr:hypothetical protein [Clostridia bacterium]
MKKILAILLIISTVLSFASCGNVSNNNSSKVEFSSAWSHPLQGGYGDTYAYATFEKYCSEVTDVVVATFVSSNSFGKDHIKYTFQVNEAILGDAAGAIEVIVPKLSGNVVTYGGRNVNFLESRINAVVGNEYLLALNKFADIYSNPNVYYNWSYATAINLDNISSSEMYNESLALHTTALHTAGIDINTCTREEIIEYVRGLTKDNSTKGNISTANTLEEIVADASAVFHIKVCELVKEVDGDLKHTEIWDCQIIDTLKGEVSADIGLVWVIFFADTVEAGDEYIVAVNGIDSDTFYSFVTKDSLRPVSEKAEIKGYID